MNQKKIAAFSNSETESETSKRASKSNQNNPEESSLGLIKIQNQFENRQKIISSFSTRNLFHNSQTEKNILEESFKPSGIQSSRNSQQSIGNHLGEYIKIKTVIRSSNTTENTNTNLESKSEAIILDNSERLKLNSKSTHELFIRPIARASQLKELNTEFSQNQFEKNTVNDLKMMIPSKFSSFTDLTKNKQKQSIQNQSNHLLNDSLANSKNYENLIEKASEYNIKLPSEDYSQSVFDYNSFNQNSYELCMNELKSMDSSYSTEIANNGLIGDHDEIQCFDSEQKLNDYLDELTNYYKNLNLNDQFDLSHKQKELNFFKF